MQVRTIDGKTTASKTGDVIRKMRPEYGFMCYNRDQRDGKCKNYEVRYKCEGKLFYCITMADLLSLQLLESLYPNTLCLLISI